MLLTYHQAREQLLPDKIQVKYAINVPLKHCIQQGALFDKVKRLIKKLTVNIEMNEARPASEVSSPSACIRYPRLTHKPNSNPAFRV